MRLAIYGGDNFSQPDFPIKQNYIKYVVVLGDGMADEPLAQLGGKTPLEYADTPSLDRLSPLSEIGLAATIPEGMKPGSDTANLAVLGYDPRVYYTGRSPLEALSIGVDMEPTDIAVRCNIVTVSDDDLPYEQKTILDHSSGEISTEDAAVLLRAVRAVFEDEAYHFYVGTSYRHLLIWKEGQVMDLTPPHDILGKAVESYLPKDAGLREMMIKSYEILNSHPINLKRAGEGKNKANSLWFWGAGTRPSLSPFIEKTGKKGAMISAVDLLKGIAVGAGMQNIMVPGANGSLDTNYEGKAAAAVRTLMEDGNDFVYIHVEAPDEMGHQGNIGHKVKSIEYLDKRIIGPVTKALTEAGVDFRMLVMPDHPTPIRCRTHVSDPVPYLIYDSRKKEGDGLAYSEANGKATHNFVKDGYRILEKLFETYREE